MVALVLASAAVRFLTAEISYGAGLGYGTAPFRDLPGRLGHYEEAIRIDPDEPLYALRAGELLLERARRDPAARGALLEAALAHLRRALVLDPIDARVRVGLAQALAAQGRLAESLEQAEVAVRLGPCWAGVLGAAAEIRLEAWHRTGAANHLVETFRLTRRCADLGAADVRRVLGRRILSFDRDPLGDVLDALVRHPDLLREAAESVRRDAPELAVILHEVAADAAGGK